MLALTDSGAKCGWKMMMWVRPRPLDFGKRPFGHIDTVFKSLKGQSYFAIHFEDSMLLRNETQ